MNKIQIKLKVQEQWKVVDDHPGYKISNWGQVWSHISNRLMKPKIEKNGYLHVKLNGQFYYVHRLVANHFISNPQNLETVDHINFCKANNHVSNLQWMSRSDNCYKKQNRTSPYKYVGFHKGAQKWFVRITQHNKWRTFDNEIDAAKHANLWITELGLNVPLNSV